jgi:hypothetical protein
MEASKTQEISPSATFRHTHLYQVLLERTVSDVRAKRLIAVVDDILEKAEEVLRAGNTSPLDFTLHDDRHSFRVAELMVLVLPQDMLPVLANEEIGLLLLSAYLHDVGMTPERHSILKYRDLLIGSEQQMDESEKREFYEWFDSSEFGDVIKLPISTGDRAGLDQLEQVLTYFIRAKHNDWSASWIERHLAPLDRYPDFKDDLIRLCKSHHYGFEELIQDDYNPKQVGVSATRV